MASAQSAEQTRLASKHAGPSPIPSNLLYQVADLDLSNPVTHPLDVELNALCQRFATSDLVKRTQLQDSLSLEDCYTLFSFSRRSAVFAMRDRMASHIVDALTAVAMVDADRIDFRDALVVLGLVYHAAGVVGANVEEMFEKTVTLAAPKMSDLIRAFLKRSEDKRAVKSWGYTVVETEGGPGFIGWRFQSYQPTLPLDQIALALARCLKHDRYQPTAIHLASELPAVWLSSVDDTTLQHALKLIRAAVSIHADLRPEESPDGNPKFLIIFLAELNDESASTALFRLAQQKQTRPNYFAMVGMRTGRLFCLAIGQSSMSGIASFETQSSMQRLATGITNVLNHQ
jgi:hypothetical protein